MERELEELPVAARSELSKRAAHALIQASEKLARHPDYLPEGRAPAAQYARAVELAHVAADSDVEAWGAAKWMACLAESDPDAAIRAMEGVLAGLPNTEPRRTDLLMRGGKIALISRQPALAERITARAAEELDAITADDWSSWPFVACATHGLQSEIALQLGLPDQAQLHALREFEVAQRSGSPALLEVAVVHQVLAQIGAGRQLAALRRIEAALGAGGDVQHPYYRAILTYRAGVVHAFQGWQDPQHDALAERMLREALDSDQLDSDLVRRSHGWLADIARRQGKLAEANDLLAWDEYDPSLAPTIAVACRMALERARSREPEVLRAVLELGRDFIDRGLERQKQLPPRPGGLGYSHYPEKRLVLSQMLQAQLELTPGAEGAVHALETLLHVQSFGSFARLNGWEPRPLADVRALLTGPKRGILLYLPAAHGGHVIGFDSERTVHAWTAGSQLLETLREEFDAQVRRAVAGASGSETLALSRAGAALAAELLPAPIAELLSTWDAAAMVGPDMLGYVAFELLPWKDGLLGDQLAVSILPSLPVGVLLAERDTLTTGGPWTLAAPTLSSERDLPPIPLDAADRERLAADAPQPARLLTEEAATLEALRSAELAQASWLHLLTHGTQRDEPPSAGLLLAASEGDREAWAEDIMELRAPPIVIISACSAARGVSRMGDDSGFGLANAFLQAGAQAVLIAREDLEYHACVDLVERVQHHLAHGVPVDEALRLARVALTTDAKERHASFRLLHAVGWGGARVQQ